MRETAPSSLLPSQEARIACQSKCKCLVFRRMACKCSLRLSSSFETLNAVVVERLRLKRGVRDSRGERAIETQLAVKKVVVGKLEGREARGWRCLG